jgi:hypothetical protein
MDAPRIDYFMIDMHNNWDDKVFQTKHGTQWDMVDFHREWFRRDLNGFQDIWALPVLGDGTTT